MILENVIKAPVVTEKAIGLNEEGIYVFFIDKDATKVDIKIAFSSLFGREVSSVKTTKLPKKTRSAGKSGTITKRQSKRKAYVKFTESTPFELRMVKK